MSIDSSELIRGAVGWLRIRRAALVGVAVLGVSALYAAKGDKPEKSGNEKRIEKIERKLERQGAAELAAAAIAQQRPSMIAAPAPEPERSRSDRGDGSYGLSRSRSRDRGEYREPTTPADAKYDNFRVIVEKNIFNPNRIGRTRERTDERTPRVDTIALVGTMQSDQGVVAFFDSPDSAYRKTLREGQSVGEFKVTRIKPNEVELVRDGKSVSLRVAEQLSRPEGGEWTVAAVEPPRTDAPGTPGAVAAPPSQPMAIPADASDALRRLMEARNKQLK